MSKPTHQELLLAIHNLELQVQQVKRLVQDNLPQAEWLTTQQFAELTGLKPKTISNYAGKGRFSRIKKTKNQKYLIHITELELWQ